MSNIQFLKSMSDRTLALVRKEFMKQLLDQEEVTPEEANECAVYMAVIDEILAKRQASLLNQ